MNPQQTLFSGVVLPDDDVLTRCMHCGLCLPVCPTYAITGREKSSPRGRIRLIKSVAKGTLGYTDGFIEEMNFCLDCQACETACPAGVKYGSLVESARNQIRTEQKGSFISRSVKWFFIRQVLSKKNSLQFFASMLRMYQRSGIVSLFHRSVLLQKLFPKLTALQDLAPKIDERPFDELYPEIIAPPGTIKYRVGFLTGCVMNSAFAGVHEDTVKVLLHHDCEVVMPKQQVCCGSLQAHNGDFETSRSLAKTNIDIFLSYDLDAIIMNSAGCGALMKEYAFFFRNDPIYEQKAQLISSKIKDLSEFLTAIGLKRPPQEFPHSVSYHDACHLVHSQKISREPRMVIQSITGVLYKEMDEASWCCGSAGIYNVVRHSDSMQILARKVLQIQAVDVEYLVASNPGCIAQLDYGITKNGMKTKIVHLATLLRMAYRL
ncbi:MAG: (Fe-S)-binding protein [Bacteroidota bacterium]